MGASIKDVHTPGGVCQKCTKSVQGGRGFVRIVYVHIFEDARASDFFRSYKCANSITKKNRGKKNRDRACEHAKIEF